MLQLLLYKVQSGIATSIRWQVSQYKINSKKHLQIRLIEWKKIFAQDASRNGKVNSKGDFSGFLSIKQCLPGFVLTFAVLQTIQKLQDSKNPTEYFI